MLLLLLLPLLLLPPPPAANFPLFCLAAPLQVGKLWCRLADFYIRQGHFERARDVFEEAVGAVVTVRDFGTIFDTYAAFEESVLTAKRAAEEEDSDEVRGRASWRGERLSSSSNHRQFSSRPQEPSLCAAAEPLWRSTSLPVGAPPQHNTIQHASLRNG